jgi:hypothetical protein
MTAVHEARQKPDNQHFRDCSLNGASAERQLDTIPAIGKFFQSSPQPHTEKRSQEMSGAKALSVSLMEIRNVENFYREGDDANPDDEWPSFFWIKPPD